jgi:RNA polymerase sigma factor (sigma-70 family)
MVRVNGGAGTAPSADPAHRDALAREALRRDPEAIRRFLLVVAPTIGRACRGVMGTRHTELEDTIQECFIDVTRGLPYYRFEGNLLGFVAKIAIRRALVSRRRSVARSQHLQLLDDLHDQVPVDANIGELERAEVVRDLIRRVRPIQAETLVMRVVLGFTVEEIALATEVSVNTVKTRLRLGKNALRKLFAWHARPTAKERGR